MTKRINDRDMLVRTLSLMEGAPCCDFFACPGDEYRPVPMASCAKATAVWDLREYMRRNGGWCREHYQELRKCHSLQSRCPDGNSICRCNPIDRTKR